VKQIALWFHRWLWLKLLVITIAILLLSHIIVFIFSRISILDSLGKSVSDFDFTDLYYSNISTTRSWLNHDSTIVIVNIGQLDRKGIAQLIDTINLHKPKVLGIDIFFQGRKDSIGDYTLSQSISKATNCVLITRLVSDTSFPPFDTVEYPDGFFLNNATPGYGNINIPEEDKAFGTVRGFIPTYLLQTQELHSFASEVARHFDTTSMRAYSSESSDMEFINFFGTASKPWLNEEGSFLGTFTALNYDEILSNGFESSLLKDKIVLLGYLGDINNPDHNQRYYTPLNERYAGRSLPDMFAVEIHANIIKMILDRKHIWNSRTLDILLSLLILLLSVWGCEKIHEKNPQQFQLISTAMIFLLVNILIFIPLLIFIETNIKIDLRSCLFYLIVTPTIYEVTDINLFERLETIRKKEI
jgi:CHASE2 domain-containing sensor protein